MSIHPSADPPNTAELLADGCKLLLVDTRFRIREITEVGPAIARLVVDAPRVARHARAGQFVIVRPSGDSERIPLTICDVDTGAGTITLVVQAIGGTTTEINAMAEGSGFSDVLGPLGLPTEMDRFGTCVVVAGGVGVAIVLPVAKALTEAGNRVIGIVGARDADHLILVDEMRDVCDEVLLTTEDGSVGARGFVTDALERVLGSRDVDRILTAGPIPMMRAVAERTRPYEVPTIASLNPIMVDGTGMCGGCRVTVGGETLFACIDGPEFDAHAVDFESLEKRNEAYRVFEACRLGDAREALDA
jgi:NAD(P)H-flavin reductase